MDINYYKKYEPIEGKWYITKELGSGAFGTVFEVERRDFSNMKSALKVISIPSTQSEVQSFREENYTLDEKSVTSYFYGFVEEFIKEIQLMSELKGHSNIVSYEDHDVIKRTDGIGWDIFIRMELLTPMNRYFRENTPKTKDVIKLGIDICKALEVCQKYKIIHRDIKPSNIFVSKTGEFKLGDFGVARTLEKTSSGLSKKGTYTYMAPEVYKGEAYGSNVDIYSLGIAMYKLLNNNLEPFRKDMTYADGESALEKRMCGTDIPKPANADGRLAEIVLKACNYNPKDRYESPLQMREELENILYTENEREFIYPNGDEVDYEPSTFNTVDETDREQEKTMGMFDSTDARDEDQDETVGIFGAGKEQTNLDFDGELEASKISASATKAGKIDTDDEEQNKNSGMRLFAAVIAVVFILGFMYLFADSFLTFSNLKDKEQSQNPYNNMGYVNVTGRTIADIAKDNDMELSELLEQYGLPADMPGDTYEYAAYYTMPVKAIASQYGMSFDELKELLGFGDEITEDTPWGIAEGEVTIEKYMGADNFGSFKEKYGLGDEITLETKWKDVRNIVDNVSKQEYEDQMSKGEKNEMGLIK